MTPAYRTVYRRIETDVEFRERILAAIGWRPWQLREAVGDELDVVAWSWARMQRRLVEDVS